VGADGDGEAYLGVVSPFSAAPGGLGGFAAFGLTAAVFTAVVVAVAVVAAVVVELPLVLLDDPQPAVSASAQQAITVAMPVFIGCDPFSTSSCNRTIAYRGPGA
jgi:hypothetical protein